MKIDRQLEDAYKSLLSSANSATPSQVAKLVGGNRWRNLEAGARAAGARLGTQEGFEYVNTPHVPQHLRRS